MLVLIGIPMVLFGTRIDAGRVGGISWAMVLVAWVVWIMLMVLAIILDKKLHHRTQRMDG